MKPREFAIALKWSFHRFAILLCPEVPPTVCGRVSFLVLSALISFQKSLHCPLCSFENIDWERRWSFSLKNFISCLKAARAGHFSSASGPLLGRPAIFQWLTASLYWAFNSFARSFYPGTLNFEGFCIPNIPSLLLLSIAFGINVNKSLSYLHPYPCWPAAVQQVQHQAYYPTSDRTDI